MKNFIKDLVYLPNKKNKKFTYNLANKTGDEKTVNIFIDSTSINISEDAFNQMVVDYLMIKQASTLTNKWLIVEKENDEFIPGVPTPKQKLEILKRQVYEKLGIEAEKRSPKTIKKIFHDVFPEDARSTASWRHLKENAVNLGDPMSLEHLEKIGVSLQEILKLEDFDFVTSSKGKKYDVVKNQNFICFSPL